MTYDAFVYIWINLTNGQRYIGSHKGCEYDNYDHSSTNIEFRKHMFDGKNTIKRKIIARGTYNEMLALETRLLKKYDVGNNPKYYNQSSNTFIPERLNMPQTNIKLVKTLINELPKRKIENMQTEEIKDFVPIQTRESLTNNAKVKDIAERIKKAGNLNNMSPISIVRYEDGTMKIVDGNNTLKAASQAKIPEVKVQIIDFKEFENNHLNVLQFGISMNNVKIIKEPATVKGIKHTLKLARDSGQDISDRAYKLNLAEVTGKTLRSISGYVTSVRNDTEETEETFRTWYKDELKAEQAKLQKDYPEAEVQYSATGSNMEWRLIATVMRDMVKNKKTRGICIVHHSKRKHLNAFDMKELRAMITHYKLKITIVELSHEPVR